MSASTAATTAEIVAILGRIDDGLLMRILETGASAAEILEAYTWASANDQIGTDLAHRPRGPAAQVLGILEREEAEADEPQ